MLFTTSGTMENQMDNMVNNEKDYGSYQLLIRYDDDTINVGLYIPIAPSEAYEVYFNHEMVRKVGEIGKEDVLVIWEYKPVEVNWLLSSDLLITIHVSDFNYQEGGFYKSIILGTESELHLFRQMNPIKDSFALGLMGMLLMFLILVKAINKNTGTTTGYLIVISILYVISTGELLATKLIPSLDFKVYYQMYYSMSIIRESFLVLLLNSLYERKWEQYVVYPVFSY